MTIARLIGFLVFAVFLGASAATGQTTIAVRIATLPSDGGAQAFYAKDKGFFARGGLDAEVTVMNSSAIAPAIASGTFDIAQSTLATLAAAREHGQPFVVIAPSQLFLIKLRPTAGIVVAKTSPIKAARDFSGKIVAVSQLLGIAQVTTEAWIDKNGGDSSTVKFIEMPPSAMVPALEQGRVDAAEFGEPELAEALSRGHRSLSSGYEAVANQFQIGAWYCTSSYAAAHPEVIRRFANVMAETARWANAHQGESGQILAKWTKLTVDPAMPRVIYGERLHPTLMQPLIDVAAKYKALRSSIPASEMIVTGIRLE
jgi:NitT/TauT family transport system substrate-binding protein